MYNRTGDEKMNIPLPCLGNADHLEKLIDQENIRLVVIAMERTDQAEAEKIVQRLSEKDVEIKIIPDILDILSGSVKTSNLFGALLSDIHTGLMPEWQMHIKRLVDVFIFGFCPDPAFPPALVCRHPGKISSRDRILFPGKNRDIKEKNS